MTTQTINLDMIPNGVSPIIHASQYDKGQTWIFTIFADGVPFEIPAGSQVSIQGTKPDRNGFIYSCTYEGSQVTAIEEQQMTVLPGDVETEIRVAKDNQILGSVNFIIRVEAAALAEDTPISETELAIIEQAEELIEQVPGIIASMTDLKEDAEAWAVGERDGQPVPSTDPTYNNNAKYYAGQYIGKLSDSQYAALQTLFA